MVRRLVCLVAVLRRYAKVRLNKHSAARLSSGGLSVRGVHYRFLLPGNAHFVASKFPLTARIG